jgi:hypothetical protein
VSSGAPAASARRRCPLLVGAPYVSVITRILAASLAAATTSLGSAAGVAGSPLAANVHHRDAVGGDAVEAAGKGHGGHE